VLGSVDRLVDEAAARQAVSALRIDINAGDARFKAHITTVSELAEHYRQRELRPDTVWKTYSTKVTYEGYLNKWILPRWGSYPLVRVNAGQVELWLRSLTLARASCAKIRNLMSVLFNHGIRYEICNRNPIQLVRQSAKRKAIPVVLSPSEVQRLLSALSLRERTLVLVAFGTGLRMSELFALKWRDVNFQTNEVSIVRSIVFQVISPCKTEASQKPIPLDPQLADALLLWRQQTRFRSPDDWVFASPATRGQHPYWGQCIMRTFIRPAALKVGILKPFCACEKTLKMRANTGDQTAALVRIRSELCLFVPTRIRALRRKFLKGFGVPNLQILNQQDLAALIAMRQSVWGMTNPQNKLWALAIQPSTRSLDT